MDAEDQSDYVEQVVDRSRKLIQTGIWEGIEEDRLANWLGSLRNCGAELLGAYLLDNLAFRSRQQYASLLDTVFHDLHLTVGGKSQRLLDVLASAPTDPELVSVRVVPVIGQAQPPTKSGPYILRLAQRRYRMKSEWLAWAHSLHAAKDLTHIFFVDDFCGTGEQFETFLNDIDIQKIRDQNSSVSITYLVTVIHSKGRGHLKDKFPFVNVVCGESLLPVNAVMSPEALARYRVPGFAEEIEKQYESVLEQTGLPTRGKMTEGFGSLGLAFAFTHATPNNTLPIFWMSKPKLAALLDR